MAYWLYIAHRGTPEEGLKAIRKVVPADTLIAITDDHDFLYKNGGGSGPVGGYLIAAELENKQQAELYGKSLTLLEGDHKDTWKWAVFDRAPGARQDDG